LAYANVLVYTYKYRSNTCLTGQLYIKYCCGHQFGSYPQNKTVMKQSSYKKMALMLTISFVIMYSVMFMNVDSVDHIYLSLTRTYMSLLMVTPMALLMLWLMGNMYPNKKLNKVIGLLSAIVFVLALVFLRNQTFVSDREYMQAMIPHHSSAIMTSKHATITDPEVKKLSEGIIASQEREIAEMKQMLQRMK